MKRVSRMLRGRDSGKWDGTTLLRNAASAKEGLLPRTNQRSMKKGALTIRAIPARRRRVLVCRLFSCERAVKRRCKSKKQAPAAQRYVHDQKYTAGKSPRAI